MGKHKKHFKAVSAGAVNPFLEGDITSDKGDITQEAPVVKEDGEPIAIAFTDWSVCKMLGWKRRALVQLRKTLRRGPDWTVVNGEVAMTAGWCWERKLPFDTLTPAGLLGLTSMEVEGFVINPQLILAKRIEDGVTFPVRVKDSAAFKRGMVFEARGGFSDIMEIAYAWPRRDY